MARIKYNVEGVESGRTPPKPGTYKAKVHSLTHRDQDGKNDIEVVLEITDGKYKGSRLWSYVGLGEASAWKMAEFVLALGKGKKGFVDTEKDVGKKLGITVTADEWKGEYRARVSKFLTADSMEDDEDEGEDLDTDDEDLDDEDDEESDEDEDESDEDEDDEEDEPAPPPTKARKPGTQKVGGKKAAKVVEPEPEEDEEDEEDDSEDEEESDEEPEDYEAWSEDELREELESRGMSTRGSKKALIARIQKDDASAKPF